MTRYAAGRYHRASGTRNAFAAWSADLIAEGYPEPVVNSGDREEALQEQIFREAYDPSSGPKDVGPFNDRRFWPGHGYWKRVRGNATIAAPGASNHEKRRASDLAYPYDRDTPAHRRGQTLAKRYNITCEGLGFREWWHWTFWGPLGTIGAPVPAGEATSAAPEPTWEDDDMRIFKDTSGTFWFVRPGAQIAIRGVSDLQLLRRMLNSRSTIDGKDSEALFNPREADIIRSYVS